MSRRACDHTRDPARTRAGARDRVHANDRARARGRDRGRTNDRARTRDCTHDRARASDRPRNRAHARIRPRDHARAGERGSVSLFLVIFAIAAFALLALLVDGGTALNAKMRAADIAEQAARAAANQVDVDDLRSPDPSVVIGPGACAAAAGIVAQYQVTSHTSAALGDCDAPVGAAKATVYVSVRTSPVIPLLFGSFTMTASASAYPACGITEGGPC